MRLATATALKICSPSWIGKSKSKLPALIKIGKSNPDPVPDAAALLRWPWASTTGHAAGAVSRCSAECRYAAARAVSRRAVVEPATPATAATAAFSAAGGSAHRAAWCCGRHGWRRNGDDVSGRRRPARRSRHDGYVATGHPADDAEEPCGVQSEAAATATPPCSPSWSARLHGRRRRRQQ